MSKRIVVIGGGITGLAAANRIKEIAAEKHPGLEVLLIEASERTGGPIRTIERDDFLVEEGPDAFITTKPWGLNLCRRLGLDGELIETDDSKRRTYILRGSDLVEIPEGFVMLAPSRLAPFLTSPLFSWRGKLRMLMDLVIPRRRGGDESVAGFVRRRLGREALDRVAQPMIGGIYTGDAERLSLRATMPQYMELEEEHGSVIAGMLRNYRQKSRARKKDSGARYSMFVSFKKGMSTLTDRLSSGLGESLRLGEKVSAVSKSEGGYTVSTDKGVYEAEGVVITTPAFVAAKLVEKLDPETAALLAGIDYASSAVAVLAYKLSDIKRPIDAFGFVVPVLEKKRLIACSFSSEKFPGRAPGGYTVLRAFTGGMLDPGVLDLGDDAIMETLKSELRPVLGITGEPVFGFLKRYPRSLPQYYVGHPDLVRKILSGVKKLKGLEIAGSALGGVGIPDCINSGESAAEKVVETVYAPGR
ncbi:MAG TPA: protoporphyrinogen oxidase [Thermodesulfobacteriota bacterium]|nr:protoporphyrinogen oxidase [Thermodesulfobacteriota bacterium]